MNFKEILTGVVISAEGPVIFICEELKFRFLTTNTNRLGRDKNVSLVPDEYGYLHGQTHDGQAIYLYTNSVLQIHSKRVFHINHYFLSCMKLLDYEFHSFRGLRVENGSLRSVFRPDSTLMVSNKGGTNIKNNDDYRTFCFKFFQTKATIRIGSDIVEQHSHNEGDSISSTVMLDLSFESSLPISRFSDAFSCIITLCRFMTGRQNIGFEKISLLTENLDNNLHLAFICCHMDNSEVPTSRPLHECIQFSDIADEIGKLAEFFCLHAKDSSCIKMEFLPPDDSMTYIMSSSIIENIVISFESAATLDGLNVFEDQDTNRLTEYLETAIKKHMNSSEDLSDHTVYTKMIARLRNRNLSLSDQIKEAYHKYKDLMQTVIVPEEYKLNRKMIKAIVDFRHASMHGRIGRRDDQICFAAHQVLALIYCCIFNAAKIPHNVIEKVLQKGVYRP